MGRFAGLPGDNCSLVEGASQLVKVCRGNVYDQNGTLIGPSRARVAIDGRMGFEPSAGQNFQQLLLASMVACIVHNSGLRIECGQNRPAALSKRRVERFVRLARSQNVLHAGDTHPVVGRGKGP